MNPHSYVETLLFASQTDYWLMEWTMEYWTLHWTFVLFPPSM